MLMLIVTTPELNRHTQRIHTAGLVHYNPDVYCYGLALHLQSGPLSEALFWECLPRSQMALSLTLLCVM